MFGWYDLLEPLYKGGGQTALFIHRSTSVFSDFSGRLSHKNRPGRQRTFLGGPVAGKGIAPESFAVIICAVTQTYFYGYLFLGIFAACSIMLAAALRRRRPIRPEVPAGQKAPDPYSARSPLNNAGRPASENAAETAPHFVMLQAAAVLLFPWAVSFRFLGGEAFIAVILFIGILLLGHRYRVQPGSLSKREIP